MAFFSVLVLVSGTFSSCASPPPADDATTASGLDSGGSLRPDLESILDRGSLKSLALPEDFSSLKGLPIENLESLDLSHTKIERVALPASVNLQELDLRDSTIQTLSGLPSSLERLDLRKTPHLEEYSEQLPPSLVFLGIEAQRVTEETTFPEELDSLALYFRSGSDSSSEAELSVKVGAEWDLIRSKLPPALRYLEIENARASIRRLEGVPERLQELHVKNTGLLTLEGLPESLDRLASELNDELNLEQMPPYLTELHLGNESKLDTLATWPRFLEILTLPGDARFPPRDLPLLEFLQAHQSNVEESEVEGLPEFPWLTTLDLRIDEPDATTEPAKPVLNVSRFPRIRGLTAPAVELPGWKATDQGVWEHLQCLRVNKVDGRLRLPPNLQSLFVGITEDGVLLDVPGSLRRLVLRFDTRVRLEGIFSQLPENLEYLELWFVGEGYLPIPGWIRIPPNLKHLSLHSVDVSGWVQQLKELQLDTLVLDDVETPGLRWLPESVRHLSFADLEGRDLAFTKRLDQLGCPVDQ